MPIGITVYISVIRIPTYRIVADEGFPVFSFYLLLKINIQKPIDVLRDYVYNNICKVITYEISRC